MTHQFYWETKKIVFYQLFFSLLHEWHYLKKWAQIICEFIPMLFSFDEMDHLIKLVYDIYWGDHVSIKKPGILVGHPWKCMHPEKWYHNESDHL